MKNSRLIWVYFEFINIFTTKQAKLCEYKILVQKSIIKILISSLMAANSQFFFLGPQKECTVLAQRSVLWSIYLFSSLLPSAYKHLSIMRNLWKRCSDLNRTVQIMSSSECIVFFVWICLTSIFWTSGTSTTNNFINFNHCSTDWMKCSDSFSFNTIKSTSSFSTFWVLIWPWHWIAWTLTLRHIAKINNKYLVKKEH